MRKLRLLAAGLLICSGLFASEKDDIRFLEELFSQKRYSVAVEESNRFIQKYPKSKYLRSIKIRIGKIYYIEDRYQEAVTSFNDSLKDPKLSQEEKDDIYMFLAKSYVGLKRFDLAVQTSNLISKKGDTEKIYEKTLLDIGKGYVQNAKYLEAQEILRKVLTLKGDYYEDAVLNLSLAAYNNSQYMKTIVYLDEFSGTLKNKENNVLVNYLYGSSYYKTNELDKALNYFNRVKNSPESTPYRNMTLLSLVEINLQKGNVGEAQKLLSMLGDQGSKDEAYKIFGNYYLVRERSTEALEYYNKIQGKKSSEIIYGVALSQYRKGDLNASLENFKKLSKTNYSSESVYYQFLIEYNRKNYKWIVDNRGMLDSIALKGKEKEAVEGIIAMAAFEIKDFALSERYYNRIYSSNQTKENIYKLIVVKSKVNSSEGVYQLIQEFKAKYPGDQEYKKNLSIILADQYSKDSKPNEAVDVYKNYLANNRDPEIVSNLIDLMITQKQYKEVSEFLNLQDASDENTYLKGIAAMGMGRYEEGEMYFSKLLGEGSTASQSIREKSSYNRIKNFFLWEKYPDVISYGQEYIAGENLYSLEDVVDKVAISYFRMDNGEKAREYFEKLKLVSNMGDYAQFQIGETYYTEKQYAKAAEAYRMAAEKAKDSEYIEKGLYWELSSLYLMKSSSAFDQKSKEYIERYPESRFKDNVLLMGADLASGDGKNQESLEKYEALYKETKDAILKENSVLKIADLYGAKMDFNKELEWIEKISDADKKQYYMAKHLQKQNKKEEAKAEFEKLLNSSVYKDYAAVELGDYYKSKKDLGKSEEMYKAVTEMESSRYKDKALFELANIERATNRKGEAVRNYTKIYVLYPESVYYKEAQVRVAETYEEMDRYKEAVKQYEELLKTNSSNETYYLEKLVFLNLKIKNKKEAEKNYNLLKKKDLKISQKYDQFFNGGESL